jgi:A/G-specific adenine glycosylase
VNDTFSARLLNWFDQHGRHDLPWQHPRTPYRVWISEIMLQQTQVATVIGYFDRFVNAFPDIAALARAPLDEVLAHWAGLGYYSRARNLHRAAAVCIDQHDGDLPRSIDALCALPGIGRSTAAAILSQAHGERVPILDGNVKRVLSRHAGIEGYPGLPAVERQLWKEAEARLPAPARVSRMPDYTQALMDLGASLCARSRPGCPACPLRADCIAYRDDRIAELPTRKTARAVPEKSVQVLIATNAAGEVLLQRRAPVGIWGGLWSLPELSPMSAVDASSSALPAATHVSTAVPGIGVNALHALPELQHRFTHFLLHIHPFAAAAQTATDQVRESEDLVWVAAGQFDRYGMPAPIRKLLNTTVGAV